MLIPHETGSAIRNIRRHYQLCTKTPEDGYPMYRRIDNDHAVYVGGSKLDNRWVVPYNPFLLLRNSAHFKVENCSTKNAVKFLYKYVCKGHDRAIVEFK